MSSQVITISSPTSYQVFQRDDAGAASVRICGTAPTSARSVQARIVRLDDCAEIVGWQPLNVIDREYSGTLTAPAGGWYKVEVKAIAEDGKVLSEDAMEKIGVGEVFICAGQSNAANHGEVRLRSEDDRVSGFDGTNWSHCKDPQRGASGEDGSPWPALGDLLAGSLDMPVAFASVAVGGTSVDFWQPGADGYAGLRNAAVALGVGGARAVLWHQGESDTLNAMSAETYKSRLTNTIRQTRLDAGYEIPWFVANVSFVPADWEQQPDAQNAIRAGQQAIWQEGLAKPGPDTDDLSDPKYRSADRIHFSELGLRAHAQGWHTVLCGHLLGAKNEV